MNQYIVNAFTNELWAGNPAAVCPLEQWMADDILQAMAAQNNLSETAFFVPKSGEADFHLRWFTPTHEVELCGHATLASVHVLYQHLSWPDDQPIRFSTCSGVLLAENGGDQWVMTFPKKRVQPLDEDYDQFAPMGEVPREVWGGDDYLLVYDDEAQVRALDPNYLVMGQWSRRGVIATALSDGAPYHFVSRFFAPKVGVNEDPVTGSAHCALFPFWQARLGLQCMRAFQCSSRGGSIHGRVLEAGVQLRGQAVTYAVSHLALDHLDGRP